MMMMMMGGFIERVINSPQARYQSHPNRWAFRCRANVRGEKEMRFAGRYGRLFQITGPATAKPKVEIK